MGKKNDENSDSDNNGGVRIQQSYAQAMTDNKQTSRFHSVHGSSPLLQDQVAPNSTNHTPTHSTDERYSSNTTPVKQPFTSSNQQASSTIIEDNTPDSEKKAKRPRKRKPKKNTQQTPDEEKLVEIELANVSIVDDQPPEPIEDDKIVDIEEVLEGEETGLVPGTAGKKRHRRKRNRKKNASVSSEKLDGDEPKITDDPAVVSVVQK